MLLNGEAIRSKNIVAQDTDIDKFDMSDVCVFENVCLISSCPSVCHESEIGVRSRYMRRDLRPRVDRVLHLSLRSSSVSFCEFRNFMLLQVQSVLR